MRKAAIYARVSTKSQTVENQIRDLRAVAERIGYMGIGEYCDHAVSGSKFETPALVLIAYQVYARLWRGGSKRNRRLGRKLLPLHWQRPELGGRALCKFRQDFSYRSDRLCDFPQSIGNPGTSIEVSKGRQTSECEG